MIADDMAAAWKDSQQREEIARLRAEVERWKVYEDESYQAIRKLRVEADEAYDRGVIAGLEMALRCFPKKNSTTLWYAEDEIRAELEKRRAAKGT